MRNQNRYDHGKHNTVPESKSKDVTLSNHNPGDFNPFLLFPLVSSQYNFEKQLKNIALIIKNLFIFILLSFYSLFYFLLIV